jgi:hypothetical protein
MFPECALTYPEERALEGGVQVVVGLLDYLHRELRIGAALHLNHATPYGYQSSASTCYVYM